MAAVGWTVCGDNTRDEERRDTRRNERFGAVKMVGNAFSCTITIDGDGIFLSGVVSVSSVLEAPPERRPRPVAADARNDIIASVQYNRGGKSRVRESIRVIGTENNLAVFFFCFFFFFFP